MHYTGKTVGFNNNLGAWGLLYSQGIQNGRITGVGMSIATGLIIHIR